MNLNDAQQLSQETETQVESGVVETKQEQPQEQSKPQYDEKYYKVKEPGDLMSTKNAFACFLDDGRLTDEKKHLFRELFQDMKQANVVLRNAGSDRNAYEEFINTEYPFVEMYKAFAKVNPKQGKLEKPKEAAYEYAAWAYVNGFKNKTVEDFNKLPSWGKAFQAADIHVILGDDLFRKAGLILIDSPCGSTSFTRDTDYENLGFRASAGIRFGKLFDITVINLGSNTAKEQLSLHLNKLKG